MTSMAYEGIERGARSPTTGSWAASRSDSPSTAAMWQRREISRGNMCYNRLMKTKLVNVIHTIVYNYIVSKQESLHIICI